PSIPFDFNTLSQYVPLIFSVPFSSLTQTSSFHNQSTNVLSVGDLRIFKLLLTLTLTSSEDDVGVEPPLGLETGYFGIFSYTGIINVCSELYESISMYVSLNVAPSVCGAVTFC